MILGKNYVDNLYEGADLRLALYNIMCAAAAGEIEISDSQLEEIFEIYFAVCNNTTLQREVDATAIDKTIKSDLVFAFLDLLTEGKFSSEDSHTNQVFFWFYNERKIFVLDLLMQVLKHDYKRLRHSKSFWTIMATSMLFAPTADTESFVAEVISVIDNGEGSAVTSV